MQKNTVIISKLPGIKQIIFLNASFSRHRRFTLTLPVLTFAVCVLDSGWHECCREPQSPDTGEAGQPKLEIHTSQRTAEKCAPTRLFRPYVGDPQLPRFEISSQTNCVSFYYTLAFLNRVRSNLNSFGLKTTCGFCWWLCGNFPIDKIFSP